MLLFFARLDEKHHCLGNFEKILKNFDENSIENLKFYFIFILEKLLLKIEPFQITPFFYTFSGFGGISPLSPWLRPCTKPILEDNFGKSILKIRQFCDN